QPGQLVELDRVLSADRNTSLSVDAGLSLRVHSSVLHRLPQIRFVITLDADTQLPHETARRMIATLAHPLNQPCFDPEQGRVVSGYGVLQPRVSLALSGAQKSLVARLYSGSAGAAPSPLAGS